MKNKLLIITGLLFSVLGSSQEDSYSLSLKEAIDYALVNNRTAKNAARDIEFAKELKWRTTATGLPQISAKIDYNNWLKQQVSLIPAEFFGGNPGEFAEIEFGTKQSMNAFIVINQKIFDGSYIVGLQSAKVFLEISENGGPPGGLPRNAVSGRPKIARVGRPWFSPGQTPGESHPG